MSSRIAVFGSAFNPPTLGHKSVLKSLGHFDRVLLVPSIAHAWGKLMMPFEQRCLMVEKFIQDIKFSNLELCRLELDLYNKSPNTVTTFALLSELEKQNPNSKLTFVVGPDNLLKFAHFYNAKEILERWSVLGCPEKVRVRSSLIRDAIKEGDNIYKTMLSPSVAEYIQSNDLYAENIMSVE